MKGQVVKVISENFYVDLGNETIICKQRGKLKNLKTLPLVGDFVLVSKEKGVIEEILPRDNMIIRPNVSNITMAFVITSFKNPDFSTNLLDKLLVQLEINKIKPVICLTKRDLISDLDFLQYKETLDYYQELGYIVVYNHEINKIKNILENNTTVFIGQTGSGKSTLLNKLFSDLNLKTGEVSLALGRGRHTTRHVEIIKIGNINVLDTPGFSALSFLNYEENDVRDAFIEFKKYPCMYHDCMHLKEDECKVKEAVNKKQILLSRYMNYQNFIEEFKNKKRW
ncbi:MAG: ribosome small subunit-dependent GTPase A [Bacilli bacterium]|nr:ribosome small subunit-dependent GTPase A [Bacilli bacterium]